jgi:hypothetical protein
MENDSGTEECQEHVAANIRKLKNGLEVITQ